MHSYRSLVAWQLAHDVAVRTLRELDCNYHPRSRAIFDQLRRAVVSVEANIVEGYALDTRALLARHIRIATGSAAESECLLRLASELEYLPSAVVAAIAPQLDRCLATLRGLLRKLSGSPGLPAHGARRTAHP